MRSWRFTASETSVRSRTVRAAFGQRRKTLGNTMGGWLKRSRGEVEDFLRARGIDPVRRGETLAVDEFVALAEALAGSGLIPADGSC